MGGKSIAPGAEIQMLVYAPRRTLDIGHCRCLEPLPVSKYVTAVADQLVNVQIDDMRASVPADVDAPDRIALG
jgi:hypothetical protein